MTETVVFNVDTESIYYNGLKHMKEILRAIPYLSTTYT